MGDLLKLIDDLTEYFRNHIEALPPQERLDVSGTCRTMGTWLPHGKLRFWPGSIPTNAVPTSIASLTVELLKLQAAVPEGSCIT